MVELHLLLICRTEIDKLMMCNVHEQLAVAKLPSPLAQLRSAPQAIYNEDIQLEYCNCTIFSFLYNVTLGMVT